MCVSSYFISLQMLSSSNPVPILQRQCSHEAECTLAFSAGPKLLPSVRSSWTILSVYSLQSQKSALLHAGQILWCIPRVFAFLNMLCMLTDIANGVVTLCSQRAVQGSWIHLRVGTVFSEVLQDTLESKALSVCTLLMSA